MPPQDRRPSPLEFLPGVLVLTSMLAGAGFSRYYLRETSRQFADSFQKQSLEEIESGDVFSLSSRLSAVGASVNWTCIAATRAGQRFFNQERGPCGRGFLREQVTVASSNNGGLRIDFTLRLPRSLELAGAGFLALQAALLALLFLGVRRVERLRAESHRRLAELAAQVAHDVRSPLAALQALLGRMSGLPEDERALVRGAVDRIQGIAVDLLEKNRAEAGPRPPAPTELSGLVARVLAEKRLQSPPTVMLDAPPPETELWGSAVAQDLERVLANLIENSVQALSGKGRVVVRLEPTPETAVLVVEDDGPGIPAEILAKLGTRGATFGKSGGSGLGLFHARTTVEAWGGRLDIASSGGRGTTVRLSLPRVGKGGGPVGAVLIDDDPLVRVSWSVAAKRAGRDLKAYPDAASFLNDAPSVPKGTPIYIDSDLGGGQRGEAVASELYASGFREIFLETGHDPAEFAGAAYLKGVRGKEPPWGDA